MPLKPVAYIIEEGGKWIPWKDWVGSNKNHILIHAVIFENGLIFDSLNGWRERRHTEEEMQKLHAHLNKESAHV